MSYIGQSIPRLEDGRLLRGGGSFVGDLSFEGSLDAIFIRSTEPHAIIKAIHVDDAMSAPGVVAVFTEEQLLGVAKSVHVMRRPWVAFKQGAEHPLLAMGKTLYVGQPVVMVVAETLQEAEDAAASIVIEYETLSPISMSEADSGEGDPIHALFGDNVVLQDGVTNGAADARMKEATTIATGKFTVPRVAPCPMEPRGVLANYDKDSHRMTVWTSTQSPHEIRTQLAHVFGEDGPDCHVIAPDVGGGFGQKHHLYPDEAVVVFGAYVLGRPVRWMEERQENIIASQARGYAGEMEIGLDESGRVLAVKANITADLGAYHIYGSFISPDLVMRRLTGPYDVQDIAVDLRALVTNGPPTGPYRGAGQPEASFMMERMIDIAAQTIEMDPAEFRRRNLIRPEQFPYTTAGQLPYDTGNYEAVLDRALELSNYYEFRATQSANDRLSESLLGIGIATITNGSGGSGGVTARSSYARLTITRSGTIIVDSDVSPHGQGMATTFAQLVSDQLGVDPPMVRLRTGDSSMSTPAGPGSGTYASRSLVIGGSAVYEAAGMVRDILLKTAAQALEVPLASVRLEQGYAVSESDAPARISLVEIAAMAGMPPEHGSDGLFELEHTYVLPASAFTFACHVAVVEVDVSSGEVTLNKYVAVHDPGPVVNPVIVKAQIMGGIAQGLGEAMQESVEYDSDGRTDSTSFMTYGIPIASDMPDVIIDLLETRSTLTPTGMKGIGEAPAAASPVAYVNAVHDALRSLKIKPIEMPLTPPKIWSAIHGC